MRLIAINYYSKIKHAFKSAENKLLAFFSISLGIVMFFFIERKSTSPHTIVFENTAIFYALMLAFFLAICLAIFFAKKPSLLSFVKNLTFCLLPAEIALIIGLFFANKETHAHILFYLFAFLYPAAISLYFICKRKRYLSAKTGAFSSVKNWLSAQGSLFVLALIVVVATNIFLTTKNIGNFAAVDEPLWTFDRIPGYWKNIAEGDFDNTAISDKPGITVALLSGIGLLQIDPDNYETSDANPPRFEITEMNKTMRLPITIFCALSLFLFYFLLDKIFGKKTALLGTSLIALSPPLIGMSRIINPDALLWIFAPLTMLSYFAFLKKRTRSLLLFTGILLGFSLLTKYVSNILIVFLLGMVFIEAILSEKKLFSLEEINKHFSETLANLGSIIIVALSVFYVFFPAAWQQPSKLFYATLGSQAFAPIAIQFALLAAIIIIDTFAFNNVLISPTISFLRRKRDLSTKIMLSIFVVSIIFVLADTYFGMRPFDFQEILSSPKTSSFSTVFLGIFTANFYPLIFTALPLTLLGVMYATIFLFKKHASLSGTERISIYIVLFILLYYLATTASGVTSTIRYQIMLFPLWGILAAIGLLDIANKLRIKHAFMTALFLMLASGIWSLANASPHYLGYASSLLPKKYIVDVKDMGDGSYEAAQFLNSLPDAKNLFVWSDKKGVCNFFVGKCDSFTGSDEFNAVKIDYFVISSGRKSRSLNMLSSRASNPYDFPKIYNSTDLVHEIIIGERPGNYVRILNAGDYLKQ